MNNKYQNLNIQFWEQQGRLGISQPSLCVQASADDGRILLDVITDLKAAGPPARRTLTTKLNSRPKVITTIRISFEKESDDLKQMSLLREGEIAMFRFTENGLESFREAVVAWLAGAEDFGVHPDGRRKARDVKRRRDLGSKDLESGELWFWSPRMDP